MSADKRRWLWSEANAVAVAVRLALAQHCARTEIAGSVRREKPEVGDVELLYIPLVQLRPDPASLLGEKVAVNVTDERIAELERTGLLARRKNKLGRDAFGEKNKLMVHVPSGIPVDLFATTEAAWFNYLVCRTGGAENNVAIASAARRRGWEWHPYDAGFSRRGVWHKVHSEREVFEFVGMPYREPRYRS